MIAVASSMAALITRRNVGPAGLQTYYTLKHHS